MFQTHLCSSSMSRSSSGWQEPWFLLLPFLKDGMCFIFQCFPGVKGGRLCRTESTDMTTPLGSHFQGVQSAAHHRESLLCCSSHFWSAHPAVLVGLVHPGSAFHGAALWNWGQLSPGVRLCSASFPSTPWCSLIGTWILTFFWNAISFLLLHSEMLLSSDFSYREPAPFWKAKGSLLTATFVLN